MATRYVDIPIIDSPFYDMSISLEGNSYIIEFTYVERIQLYTMALFDSDNNPIVQGVAVVPEYPIMLEYALPNLTGSFLLTRKSANFAEPYKEFPDRLSEYYWMMYVYNEED